MIEARHPFFHTMVVVSGTLVGCGGVAADDRSEHELQDDEWDEPSGSGGMTGTGGAINHGTGGDLLVVGGTSSGGTSSDEFEVVPLPNLGCPSEQLTCDAAEYVYQQVQGEYVDGYMLKGDCACDETRPVSPDECELGEQLTCWRLAFLDEDTALDQTYLLSCECLPEEVNCSPCEALSPNFAGPGDGISCEPQEETHLVICGASWAYLR